MGRCRKSDDHPYEDLTKSGYNIKKNKVKVFNNLSILLGTQ
jgi:hypothetical protein